MVLESDIADYAVKEPQKKSSWKLVWLKKNEQGNK